MPGGELGAMRLCIIAVIVALLALVASEVLAKRFAAHMKG
jgi:molybdate transport system permease protein